MIERVKLPIHNEAGIDEIIKKLLKQELEVTKVVNRINKSKKDKQHNGNQQKRDKRTNNDLQKNYTENQRSSNSNTTNNRCSGSVSSSCSSAHVVFL